MESLESRHGRPHGAQWARRALFALASMGAILALLQPPLPIAGGSSCPRLPFHLCPRLWDERHKPQHGGDDAALYADGLSRRDHWPVWWLVAGAGLSIVAALQPERARRKAVLPHMLQALAASVCIAAYLALEFVPRQLPVQVLVTIGTQLAAAVIVLLSSPLLFARRRAAAFSPHHVAFLLLAWIATFALALLVQAVLPLPPLPADASLLFPATPQEAERRRAAAAALQAIFAVEGLVLSVFFKTKAASAAVAAGPAGDAAGGRLGGAAPVALPRAPYAVASGLAERVGAASPALGGLVGAAAAHAEAALDGAGAAALARLERQGLGWLPTMANVVVLATFGVAVRMAYLLSEDRDEAILALAPILLLLNQDRLLAPALSPRRRYAPPLAAVAAYLTATAATDIARDPYPTPASRALDAAALLAPLPATGMLTVYLWTWRRQSEWPLLFASPLAVAAGLFAQSPALRLLSGVSVVGAVVQSAAMRRVQRIGRRLI